MCMINEMNARVKELEQMVREKDIALMGLQAKIQGLQSKLSVTEREKSQLWDQARTLHLVAHLLGTAQGEDVIKAVPEAVRLMIEERDNIRQHATHAARCQLINEIEELFRSGEPMTAGQVVDLLSVEKEVAA